MEVFFFASLVALGVDVFLPFFWRGRGKKEKSRVERVEGMGVLWWVDG